MKFLTAHWKHLVLANYSISPEVLQSYVPRGTRIDVFEGHVFVSLVAFLFDETRVLGIPVPWHRRFEEVNLRFYVVPCDAPEKRAVTFVREIVPRRVIPWVANGLFGERYVACPMSHRNGERQHRYAWNLRGEQVVEATLDGTLAYPEAGSVGEFITEHYWGYSQGRGATLEYRVEHPQWRCCEVAEYRVAVDFAATYGERFAFLNGMTPYNVQYAVGSEVAVYFPRRLRGIHAKG